MRSRLWFDSGGGEVKVTRGEAGGWRGAEVLEAAGRKQVERGAEEQHEDLCKAQEKTCRKNEC